MAFTCTIFLKNECDGCGMCEDRNAFGQYSRGRSPLFGGDDEDYNPFEPDWEEY